MAITSEQKAKVNVFFIGTAESEIVSEISVGF
jgi:hypothetical protein